MGSCRCVSFVHGKKQRGIYFDVRHAPSDNLVDLFGAQKTLGEKSLSDTLYPRLMPPNEHSGHRTKASLVTAPIGRRWPYLLHHQRDPTLVVAVANRL